MNRSTHTYVVHGLVIASELELPELSPSVSDVPLRPDIKVRLGRFSPELKTFETDIPFLFTTEEGPLLEVPGAARFAVRRGRDVTVEIADNPDMELLRLFLFGSVIGLACHQRGLFPLHASAVALGDRAIAFCGPPQMGKSTLAAFCVDAGARLVADDVLVVSIDGGSHAMANPGMPKVKLWRDAIEVLGRTTEGLTRDWARAEKFHLPAGRHIVTEPVRLSHIFVLESDENAGVGVTAVVSGAEAVSELIQNTYRPEYLDVAHRRASHFAECVRLSKLTKVTRLRRRRDPASLVKTAAMLLDSHLRQP
jgi:hypothetical protein